MKKKILYICLFVLINIIFIDIVGAETYNNYDPKVGLVSCGDKLLAGIPPIFPQVVSIIYTIIQIAVPVVLVIMGSIDLVKGITASKDDEIKKGQQMFIKRLIVAVVIFLVFVAVKFLISLIATDDKDANKANRILDCAECFISNDCEEE